MAGRHHLRLFGSVELLEPDGCPVRFRTRKQLALLVYLALEARDRLVDRSCLVDLFWDGVAHKKGSHSLAQALTAIRAALGSEALPRFTHKVQLLADLTTDLDSLAPRAFRAEDLGRPLPQLEGCGGRSFGLWIETVRGRCLADVRRRLVADLSEARRGGLVQEARECATLLHAIDPANELAALVVAEHMAADGDLDGAVSLLRRHVADAKEELGRSPSRELAGFLQRLERGLFRTLSDPATDADASLAHARPEVFVGREHEVTCMESLWTRARDGQLVTAIVAGPGGIGKSTLVRRFATGLAARGWPAYLVSCQEIGRSIPFAAVSDLTLQLARDPAVAGTDPQWLAEASRVTPGLRSVYTGVPEPQPTPAEAVRLRVAEALLRM
ncbi:MAG: AAA family ATPase, partial [Gemmatimonadota bacterium]